MHVYDIALLKSLICYLISFRRYYSGLKLIETASLDNYSNNKGTNSFLLLNIGDIIVLHLTL